jgi:hypothetical protein
LFRTDTELSKLEGLKMTRFRKAVFAAIVSTVMFVGLAHAGQHLATRVTAVGTGLSTTGVNVATIVVANTLTGSPACATTTNRMAIDLSTTRGKQAASLATSALMSKVTVAVVGTGTCLTVPTAGTNLTMESLAQISILAP